MLWGFDCFNVQNLIPDLFFVAVKKEIDSYLVKANRVVCLIVICTFI